MIVNPNISYDEPLQSYGPSGNIQVGGGRGSPIPKNN